MKNSIYLFFVCAMLSCQSDNIELQVDKYNLDLRQKSVSIISDVVLDFSARAYVDGVRLSWTLNASDSQVMLRNSSFSPINAIQEGELIYRGVNDFFEDVSAELAVDNIYYFTLFTLGDTGDYEVSAQLTISLDEQSSVNLLPIESLIYLVKNEKVFISWDYPNDIEIIKFDIVINDVLIASSTAPFWTDRAALIGQFVSYEVYSVNSLGVRSNSVIGFDVTIPEPIVEVIIEPQIIAENNQAQLQWSIPESIYYLKTLVYRDSQLIYEDLEGVGLFVDLTVLDNQTYSYSFSHVNVAQIESSLYVVNVTVQDTIVPENVTDFLVDARNNQASISWVLPIVSDFDSIELYRNDVNIYAGNAVFFQDLGVLDLESVIYRIQVLDTSANVSIPQQISTVVIDDVEPVIIAGLKVEIYDSQLNVHWLEPNDDYLNVEIYRSELQINSYGEGGLVHTHTNGIGLNGFKDLELINDTEYFYAVYALDASGNISEINNLSATPIVEPSLDLTFNTQGYIEFAPHDGMMTYLVDSQMDSAGRLLLLWQDYSLSPPGYKIERWLSDGQLDVTFGQMGQVISTDMVNDIYPDKLVLTDIGEIIVSGRVGVEISDVYIAKFSQDGIIKNGFGVNGELIIADVFGLGNGIYNLSEALYANGSVFLLGNGYDGTSNNLFVMKLDELTGAKDSVFAGGTGISIIDTVSDSFNELRSKINAAGQLYIVGSNSNTALLWRLTDLGVSDVTFNSAAPMSLIQDVYCTQIQTVDDILLNAVDEIYINLDCYDNVGFQYYKQIHNIDTNGNYISGFGNSSNGISNYFSDPSGYNSKVVLDDQEQIWSVTSAYSGVGNDTVLIKIQSDGIVDSNFPNIYQDTFGVGIYENSVNLFWDVNKNKPIILGSKYNGTSDELYMMRLITKSIDYLAPIMNP
ncbi:MAG: hypothetical protein HRU38_09000 [Saccharospirillaceae bacterium]|nr:hypothetical protein [Pseudomonadales bacterium]NRB78792.1 hypothetical protein [Saccharospirillaceae bacterium]